MIELAVGVAALAVAVGQWVFPSAGSTLSRTFRKVRRGNRANPAGHQKNRDGIPNSRYWPAVSVPSWSRAVAPTAVRLDDEGRMYVADQGSHRIQVYRKEAYVLAPDQVMPELPAPTLLTA